MKIKEIVSALERFAPLPLQDGFDNAGLQIGLTFYGGLVYHCECEDTKKTSPRVNPAMFLTEYCNQNYLI